MLSFKLLGKNVDTGVVAWEINGLKELGKKKRWKHHFTQIAIDYVFEPYTNASFPVSTQSTHRGGAPIKATPAMARPIF